MTPSRAPVASAPNSLGPGCAAPVGAQRGGGAGWWLGESPEGGFCLTPTHANKRQLHARAFLVFLSLKESLRAPNVKVLSEKSPWLYNSFGFLRALWDLRSCAPTPAPAPLPKPGGPLDPRAAREGVPGEWVWGGAQGSWEQSCYTAAFEEAGSR